MADERPHAKNLSQIRMADVSGKPATVRRARAESVISVGRDVMEALRAGQSPKGDIYEAARIAGILAAKRTDELIPLTHSLPLDHVAVDFEPGDDQIRAVATAATRAPTGVEMEALVAAATAGLTLYDMLKPLGHDMTLRVRLLEKTGGRSGDYHAPPAREDER